MFTPMILSIPTLILPLVISPPGDCQFGRLGDAASDERALAAFEVAVEDYMVLHRRLERAWPPALFLADPEQAESAAEALRAALRDARPQAVQGGLFTPDVADVIRFRLAQAIRDEEYDLALITWPPEADDRDLRWTPVVNEPLPWGVSGMKWPFFAVLPPLPPELAFRFIGRDLVLVDVHANFVVDILDLALPMAVPTRPAARPMPPAGEEFHGCWPDQTPDVLDRDDVKEREGRESVE